MNKRGQLTVVEYLIIACILFMLPVLILQPFFRCHAEARMYNEKFGKNYTQWDFLFAGDTIKTFLNGGEQKTFNINGNATPLVAIN